MSEHDKFCAIWTSSEVCICPYLKDARDDQDTISRADEREQAAQLLADAGYQHSATFLRTLAAARGEDEK